MAKKSSLDSVRTFVNETLKLWQVHGAAVTIVKDGKVLMCEGFGLRNVAEQKPVTAHTLFPIASCSKAFTTMSVGLLVDEGKLAWDKPVREYMPSFRMHDPVATERITPRDLVTHRSGLPRHDLVWYGSNFSRKEVYDRIRHLELSKDLRTTFQYNNIMYMTAGLLVSELTDMSWEKFVKAQIFDPLGMERSNFSTLEAQRSDDFSMPYLERDGEVRQIDFFHNDGENDSTGPAGNIVSCVADMAKWLCVHTGNGKIAGTEQALISEANLRDMHSPHMPMRDEFSKKYFNRQLSAYGLGWFLHSYKGHILSEHGGNLDGFSSLTSVMLEDRLGVVVLCNGNGTALPTVITHHIYDQFLSLPTTDWNDQLKPLWDEFRKGEKSGQTRSASLRNADAKPSHPLDAYVGEYEHPGYGVLTIQKHSNDPSALQMVLNDKITLPLNHYHFDYFEAYFEKWDNYQKIMFGVDEQGRINSLTSQMEPAVKEITFTRRPARHLADPAFLAQFVGEYNLLGMPMSVALKGKDLSVTIGSEVDILVPYQGTEFQVKANPSVSFEFKRDEKGVVHEVNFNQPGVVHTAKKRR